MDVSGFLLTGDTDHIAAAAETPDERENLVSRYI